MDGGYTREQRLSAAARLISEYERQVGIPMEESAIGPILAGGSPAAAAELVRHAQRCARRLEFCAAVDAALARSMPHWMQIAASRATPPELVEVGLPDLPVAHTQKHIRKELEPKSPEDIHCHGLSIELLKRVPELLEHPAAVWDDVPSRGEVLAMLGALDGDGLPLVAIIRPNVVNETTGEPCNLMVTVYGNEKGFEKLERACDAGRVLRMDAEKMKKLLSSSAPRLRGSPRSLDGIIRQTSKGIKPSVGRPAYSTSGTAARDSRPGHSPFSGKPPRASATGGHTPRGDKGRDCSPGRGSRPWARKQAR